ncbi:uncharacterized protein LOC106883492 [Octopus bimaculoides]|nr:uncharacterized protein LOC106883492 [Octopus bimaculoides]|eukprot:XP_014790006.1 PREDICTED: uncharacterized protein LOC106883492 [Octopus bimaculoides]
MVLRTRVTVDEEQAAKMAMKLERHLGERLVQVIVKQSIWNHLQVTFHVVPVTKATWTINKLNELDFSNGPDSSPIISVEEGQFMEINFRGNLRNSSPESYSFIYNSNLKSSVDFTILEVDRYLQRNFPVFRGFLRLFRRNLLLPEVRKKVKPDEENQELPEIEPETSLELLTEILMTIPKVMKIDEFMCVC